MRRCFSITVILLLSITLAHRARATDTVTVDFSIDHGPVTYRASGFLHGLNSTTPPAALVIPLKPTMIRGSWIYTGDPGTYGRVVGLGARPMLVLSDVWGYSGAFPGDGGDYSSWNTFVANTVHKAIASGQKFQWDIWNEPDYSSFWPRSEAQYQGMWTNAVDTIRGIDPAAEIVGPSTTHWDSWASDLLSYAKTNNVLPAILSFHELNVPGMAASELVAARSFLSSSGIPISRISLNEIVDGSNNWGPGNNLLYLAAMERGQVESANHSCWNGSACGNSLDGLIMPDNATRRAAWWAYEGYAAITGRIVDVAPSANVDGVAGQDATLRRAYSVFGRNSSTADTRIQFTHLSSSTSYLTAGGKVHVTAYLLADDGGNGSTGPVPMLDADYPVTSDQVTVLVPGFGSNAVATIQLTSTESGVADGGTVSDAAVHDAAGFDAGGLPGDDAGKGGPGDAGPGGGPGAADAGVPANGDASGPAGPGGCGCRAAGPDDRGVAAPWGIGAAAGLVLTRRRRPGARARAAPA